MNRTAQGILFIVSLIPSRLIRLDVVQVLSVEAWGKFELVTNKGDCRMLHEQTRRTKTVFETEK